MHSPDHTDRPHRVSAAEAQRFATDCLLATGRTSRSHAAEHAALLCAADTRGHPSHGLARLRMYCNELLAGTCDGHATPRILRQTGGTAWVDAGNALGAVAGNWCMDVALRKARQHGVGLVCCRGANHYGMAGWYAMRAQRAGMIGWSMCNTSPVLVPPRSREPALGTNPIAFAAPVARGTDDDDDDADDGFELDMATTAAALGKIELKCVTGERLPGGWALDADGRPTTDARAAWSAAHLLPLGGAEAAGGHKGYGLAAMCEVMCGVLAGAAFGTTVRRWTLDGGAEPANLGQMFMAIDPGVFAPDFERRMAEFTGQLRGLRPLEAERPVLVPGDPERFSERQNARNGGILYGSSQMEALRELAQDMRVPPMVYLEEV